MNMRVQQGEDSRQRIIDAAVDVFANLGFGGGSTRDIATRAGTNQGLITYHFQSKEKLWQAAAGHIFGLVTEKMGSELARHAHLPQREKLRELTKSYVRFAAQHPELFRMMVDEGTQTDGRMAWLVATHIKPLYAVFCDMTAGLENMWGEEAFPHLFYTMVGASSLIFAVAPECRQLTGIDPQTAQAIEAHADLVARLLVPGEAL
jgi:TetR/AcrR family transcriptional regulator